MLGLRQQDNFELWKPVTLFVGDTMFQTTLETLCQFPGTLLHSIFTEPYPHWNREKDGHVIPPQVCEDSETFAVILEYLRTGKWFVPEWNNFHTELCVVASRLGVAALPEVPAPPLVDVYEHANVLLPLLHREFVQSTCCMISPLTDRGFAVVAEHHCPQDDPRISEIVLRRRKPTCRGVELMEHQSDLFRALIDAA